jgi:hypothetical protein
MFLDPRDFGFVSGLESQWNAIRAEYLSLPEKMFDPWVQGQMHGGGWSVFGLYAAGQQIAGACALPGNRAGAPAGSGAVHGRFFATHAPFPCEATRRLGRERLPAALGVGRSARLPPTRRGRDTHLATRALPDFR